MSSQPPGSFIPPSPPAPPTGRSFRRLHYVPIIHTQEDLGGLQAAAKARTEARLGAGAWEKKQQAISQYWEEIRAWAGSLPAQLSHYRLYQDGLPVCGKEDLIVKELAEKGGRNHQLLIFLMERGALLMGTESPLLLMEEYRLAQHSLSRTSAVDAQLLSDLLKRRDRFIADRIDVTLQPGETAVLLIGALHQVAGLLPPDLPVDYPLGQRVCGAPRRLLG